MKIKFLKKVLFFAGFLIIFTAYSSPINAAGCGYVCNSSTDTSAKYCEKIRGIGAYIGSPFSTTGAADCSGVSNCPLNSVPICCCTSKTSPVTPIGASSKPKFTLPEYTFQIPVGNLSKLTAIDCTNSATCEIPWIAQYVSAIYTYGLSVAGVIAVLMLMAAGLLWMSSGGDSGRITQAKSMIFGSITGLLLLVGLSLFLNFINPDLINPKALTLDTIQKKEIEGLAESRNGSTAENFKNSKCASDEELTAGVDFYATGYYKPDYSNTDNFFCVVAMQCSCPKSTGVNTSKVCDIYKNTYPNYHPCNTFDSTTPYCNMTSSGTAPQMGDIAGPNCSNLPKGSYVCFKGKTYRITDSGGGIKGKRIDIWSGDNLSQAYKNTGTGKLTKGACN